MAHYNYKSKSQWYTHRRCIESNDKSSAARAVESMGYTYIYYRDNKYCTTNSKDKKNDLILS